MYIYYTWQQKFENDSDLLAKKTLSIEHIFIDTSFTELDVSYYIQNILLNVTTVR